MIVYNAQSAIDMASFGVGVAHSGSRPGIILERLKTLPGLAGREKDWLHEGPFPKITRDDLLLAHSPGYVDLLLSERPEPAIMEAFELVDEQGRYHRYDPARAVQPLSGLVERSLAHVSGSRTAAGLALERGFCFFLGGGLHHAHRDRGRGFCLVNDVVLAARSLRAQGRVSLVLVIDVDAHRGDGTAALCLDDPGVLCLSVHTAAGWPLDEPHWDENDCLSRWRQPGDVDVPVPEGGEAGYLDALEKGLDLLDALRFGRPADLAVVVDGADPFEEDELESAAMLRLSLEQMLARDMLIYEWLARRGLPQCWLMAGGYGKNAWKPHVNFLSRIIPRRLTAS